MRIDWIESNSKGHNESVPSVPVGTFFTAYDGRGLTRIEVKTVGPTNDLPIIVLSELDAAILAMKKAGFTQCYIMRALGHDEFHCCWTQEG